MKLIETPLCGVKLIEPQVFGDERGFFMETWNQKAFANMELDLAFVQDNHSRSSQGILRGLHYQTEQTQGKLVRAIHGEIYDAVVDLRKSSPTYGKSYGVVLSADNKLQLWVPPGFAHGFYVLSEFAEVVYKCTDLYHPASEVSIAWDDKDCAIDWPLVNGAAPQLSAKDAQGISFEKAPKFA